MEFLGVGYQELLLVFVLMLVVVGPERLPQVAYQIGRAVRQMQRYARTVRDEFSDELGFIEEQYQTVRGEVDVARTEFRVQQQQFNTEVRDTAKSIDADVPDELKGRGNVIPINSATSTTSRTTPAATSAGLSAVSRPVTATPASDTADAGTPVATPVDGEVVAAAETPAPATEPAPRDANKPPLVF